MVGSWQRAKNAMWLELGPKEAAWSDFRDHAASSGPSSSHMAIFCPQQLQYHYIKPTLLVCYLYQYDRIFDVISILLLVFELDQWNK